MQQINLYTDAFKPPKVILPLEQILVAPILLLLVLIVISYGLSSYLSSQEEELGHAQTKHDEMSNRISVLSEKAEKMRQDDGLIASNQRLTKTLIARQNMISTLDKVVVKESSGFSSTLVSLARQNESGLWLSSILIASLNQQMILEGQTIKADLVPAYLQKLRNESSFVGRNFSLFELKEVENQLGLSFVLKAEDSAVDQALRVQPLIVSEPNVAIREEAIQ